MLRRPEPRAVDRDSDEGARFELAPHFETRATARLQTPCARPSLGRPRACSSLTTVPDSREPPTVDRLERPPADSNVPPADSSADSPVADSSGADSSVLGRRLVGPGS